MARAELYVGELLLKLVGRETGEISKVDYRPQKPGFLTIPASLETFLDRATPESQGVSSAFFYDLISGLNNDKECNMHRFMALRHGKVIAECAFEPYNMDMWHVSYSMCKSITSMAIGILIDEGKLSLETRLNDIFSSRMGVLGFFKKTVTVQNLLNMSSGVDFNEAGAISGNDWRKSFLESGFKFDPGVRFEYNSMNTYMLSAIVTEITGQSLFEFCKERIFDPMGIRRIFWESCPQSITKGGWGLFIRAEDMAKLGQLYLQKGKWEGTQIVPEMWVNQSTSWQIETNREDNKHYGFQIWINDDRPGSFSFNGMLGQNVFVYPDVDMVIVTNAGNADIFQTSTMAKRIRDMMKNDLVCSDKPLPDDNVSLNKLKALCKSISGRTGSFPMISGGGWKERSVNMTTGSPSSLRKAGFIKRKAHRNLNEGFGSRREKELLHQKLKELDGKKYSLETSGYGIFPVMMQVVHNNFTDGMKSIGFRMGDNNSFFIDIYEGEMIFPLKCGFSDNRYVSNINMHGENYMVSVKSLCTRDEYNRFVIRNEIHFIEEACMRTFDLFFEDDSVEIRMRETPGSELLMDTISTIAPENLVFDAGILPKIVRGGMKEALTQAIQNTVCPCIKGTLM